MKAVNSPGLLPRLLMALLLLAGSNALAWDATGHRLSAYVAWEFMTPAQRSEAFELLQQHPRYRQDFEQQMPDFIRRADVREQQRWIFGQAAIWPDMARRLSQAEQQRYHRPEWHWTDGAWVRGRATQQGDVYINTDPRPVITGPLASTIREESQADNVVTALELAYNRLQDSSNTAEQRAIALSWLLHLVGDLHQPLHTGGLVSDSLFPDGDRGGNAIRVRGGNNLHAVWDRALRDLPFQQTLNTLFDQAREIRREQLHPLQLDAEQWLQESREHLHDAVYSPGIRNAVIVSESSGDSLPSIALSDDYVADMRDIARERIALSGLRLTYMLSKR